MAKFCESCGHPLDDYALFCDKCGKKTSAVCGKCGAAMAPGELFCQKCGTKAGASPLAQQPKAAAVTPPAPPPPAPRAATPPQYAAPQYPARPAVYAPVPQKKSKAGLFIGLGLGAVALIVLCVVVGGSLMAAFANQPKNTTVIKATSTEAPTAAPTEAPSAVALNPFPDELKVSSTVKVNCSYKSPDTIIPANYRSMDYIVSMQCWTDRGASKVMVSVEIPGFTQKYEQMVDVSRAETELTIHPPLLADAAKSLNSSKDAELVVSVTDVNTNKVILQDTKPVKLYSRYDMQWEDAAGTPYYENILAWVTPEAPQIDKMLRDSADSLSELSGGAIDSIVGYQKVGDWSEANITYAQVCSMMYTLAHKYKVKYVMAPFSATSANLQSVATPAKVITNKAGLCVETAVTMASAIQRTNMHAVIILLPGHAQVAVETWTNSGEYLLIETTALDAASASNFDKVVTYMTKDQWTQYMAKDGVVAIDCALAEQLHITSID